MTAPYRRYSDPWILTVTPTSASTQVTIADDAKYPGVGQARSFEFVNKTPYYVRLRGSSALKGGFQPVTATTGHVIAPYSRIIRSSQKPDWISVQSFDDAGITAGSGTCEINYGTDGA